MEVRPHRIIKRKITNEIKVGKIKVGGSAPISVQSMTNTLTTDIKGTIEQIHSLEEAGADIVRVSCPDKESTKALKDIVKENIFNILDHSNLINIEIKESNVLDLYSGIGSFGIECISRGAKKVIFIENYKNSKISMRRLEKITVRDFRSWLTHEIKLGTSTTTLRRYLSSVKEFYNWLSEKKGVYNKSILNVQMPKKYHE